MAFPGTPAETEGTRVVLLLAASLARRLRPGLRSSDVRRHLAHEFLKVAQALQPVDDYRVVDLDVVMHEYVAEPDSLADRDSQLNCKDSVAQMCCATSTQASMAVTKVYFTPRSQMGSWRRSSLAPASCRRTAVSSAMLRSSRRTRSSSTTGYPRLPVTLAANSRCARVMRGSSSK
jgi:hypothetical protein